MKYEDDSSQSALLNRRSGDCRRCSLEGDGTGCLVNLPASPWILSRTRRAIDGCIALTVLVVFAAPIALLAAAVRLTSSGTVLFSQKRMGKGGCLFTIYKFRSMREAGTTGQAPRLTRAGDGRITPLGKVMRRFKLDELPQFYNVLRGEMSIVGPRPKLPEYAGLRNMPYRPGITGAATIAFRHEESLLRGVIPEELNEFYGQTIKPAKARLDVCYMCKATPASDLLLMIQTLSSCMSPGNEVAALGELNLSNRECSRWFKATQEESSSPDG
ncbi:MAG: sugar transferase [Terracidiphilus sp.]